jgi:hypothetical protein
MRDILLGEKIAIAGFAGKGAKAALMRKLKEERDILLSEKIAIAGFAGEGAKAALMRKLKEENDSLNWRRMLRAEKEFLESVSTRSLRVEGEYVFPNEPKAGDSNSLN